MRVEPHNIGSIVHVIQRGTRGAAIMRDEPDRLRFRKSLFYLNDTHTDSYWHAHVATLPPFERPMDWPEREPLVHILAWTLLPNHFHLLLQEIQESGLAKFMQRLCGSMSTCFNAKYNERGSLFQGGYRGKTVTNDAHLSYLAFYVLVKNVLDAYPGGLMATRTDFNRAWEWAKQYQDSSFRDHVLGSHHPAVDDPEGLVASLLGFGDAYKQEARELLDFHLNAKGGDFAELMLEDW